MLGPNPSSDPTTPSESPQSLDSGLRGWLTETLNVAAVNPKVYVKTLVSNAAAGSIIGKASARASICRRLRRAGAPPPALCLPSPGSPPSPALHPPGTHPPASPGRQQHQ